MIDGYRFRVVNAQVAVLAFDDLTIAATGNVQFTGTRALILVARNTITIAGEINADGGLGMTTTVAGPGGGIGAGDTPATGCGLGPNGDFNTANSDAGGGAGGSFGEKGGNGGGSSLGAAAANACAQTLKLQLQGGSGGGRGGDPLLYGSGGGGGGALQFTAGREISVTGLLHASGAGGQSSQLQGGGGGAGAGGGFLFEAPTVNIVAGATVVANGGGGGDGNNILANGESGRPDLSIAKGAGNGGDGGVIDTVAKNGGGNQNSGSGGGGGGIGKIEIQCVNLSPIAVGANVSPLSPAITTLVGI